MKNQTNIPKIKAFRSKRNHALAIYVVFITSLVLTFSVVTAFKHIA